MRRATTALLAAGLVAASPFSAALPAPDKAMASRSPTVAAGEGTVTVHEAATTIRQSSPYLELHLDSFDLDRAASLEVIQSDATALAVIRVGGYAPGRVAPSRIEGRIHANGKLLLVNQSGFVFGASARVDAADLALAAVDIGSVQGFGTSQESLQAESRASIVNHGRLSGAYAGRIRLSANRIDNDGEITVAAGEIELDAAPRFAVSLGMNGADTVRPVDDAWSASSASGVRNGGTLRAEGGLVQLIAKGGSSLHQGDIDVSGRRGGTVRLLADREVSVSGNVDASGREAGGTIRVGGGRQGGENLLAAATISIGSTARLNADAVDSGDGGSVVVWSRGATAFLGRSSAAGGRHGGNGGYVETSGAHIRIADDARVSTHAEHGKTGEWLIDPYNLTISTASSSGMSGFDANADDSVLNVVTLTSALASSGVTVTTGSSGAQGGNITVAAPIAWSANTTLTLNAAGGVYVNQDISATGASAGLALTYAAGYSLGNGARITLSGASASLSLGGASYTLIHDATTLQSVSGSTNYAVANDIDASATANWDAGAGFLPLGGYLGTFTGLGHAIDRLTVNRPGDTAVGLFALTSGTLRDLTLSNESITGGASVGGLAGRLSGATAVNIHVTGSITGLSAQIGGLVGWSDIGTIAGCSSTAAVAGVGETGGLVGRDRIGTITDSYATGSVTGTDDMTGGLVGDTVQGASFVAVYASGKVTGTTHVGGLVGFVDSSGAAVSSAYWDVDTSGQSGSDAGVGISNSSAFTQATYAGFDFVGTWVMIAGQTRPMLGSEFGSVVFTPHALQLISESPAANYSLGADIDFATAFTDFGDVWGTAGFDPLGNSSANFTGGFYGNGHTIKGLTIQRGSTNYIGLFGVASGAKIGNVTLTGGSITGSDGTGALVGYLQGGTVTSVSASATVSGTSTSETNVGGLIGTNDGGAVSLSSASGGVTGAGYQVGGLVGYLTNGGTITQSFATGNVTGTNANAGSGYVGGLVGASGYTSLDGGSISQSFAGGKVTAAAGPIGGFIGHNEGSITDAYASGRVIGSGSASNIGGFVGVNFFDGTITAAYSTGYVTGGSQVGGFAGYNNAASAAIASVYWDTQTSGQASGLYGGNGGVTARTTAQLQGVLPTGFSAAIWGTGPQRYPYFGWTYPIRPDALFGTVYSGPTTPVADVAVLANNNTIALDALNTAANGYYYRVYPAGTLNNVLTYAQNYGAGGAFSGVAFVDGYTGVLAAPDIVGDTFNVRTTATAWSSVLADLGAVEGTGAATALANLPIGGLHNLGVQSAGAFSVDSALSAAGTLAITSSGALTQSAAISATGAATLDSGSAAMTLTDIGNDFMASVALSGAGMNVFDANNLDIASVADTGNGAVRLIAGATLSLPASGIDAGTGNLTLDSMSGSLTTVGALNGAGVSLSASAGLQLANDVTASGVLSLVSSTDAITQTSGVVTATTLTGSSAANVDLPDANAITNLDIFPAANFSLNDTQALTLTGNLAQTGTTTLTDDSDVSLDADISTAGLSVISAGTVTLGNGLTVNFASPPATGAQYTLVQALTVNGTFGPVTVSGLAATQAAKVDYTNPTRVFLDIQAVATHVVFTGIPASVHPGDTFVATVSVLDGSNAVVTDYAGTLLVTSTDPGASLGPLTLSNGVGTLSVTFATTGSQQLTATDTVNASITGTSAVVSVAAAATASPNAPVPMLGPAALAALMSIIIGFAARTTRSRSRRR